MQQPEGLFPRVALRAVEEPGQKPVVEKKKKKEKQVVEKQEAVDGVISFEQVMAVQLRTARVVEAEKIEGADKLLRLQVDLGSEKRQIVAGIALHYAPEALINKTVVVVVNLKPAKLRGVVSEGMLLAASAGDDLQLVSVEGDLPPGSTVK